MMSKEDIGIMHALWRAKRTTRQICDQMNNPSLRTVQRFVRGFKLNAGAIPTVNAKSTGRPRKLQHATLVSMAQRIDDNPFLSAREIKEATPALLRVSLRTVSRRLHTDLHFTSRKARRKPRITELQISKRLQFCNRTAAWPIRKWRQIIWSDEALFTITGNTGKRVWRRPTDDPLDPRFLIKSVRQPKRLMAWACFGYYGRGPIIFIPEGHKLTGASYRKLLVKHISFSFTKCKRTPRTGIFMQDGAPVHRAKVVHKYLSNKHIQLLEPWPPQSPDLNPIENCWAYIKKRLEKCILSNQQQLVAAVTRIWNRIPHSYFKSLVNSMPGRIQEGIDRSGRHTKY